MELPDAVRWDSQLPRCSSYSEESRAFYKGQPGVVSLSPALWAAAKLRIHAAVRQYPGRSEE
jgi:hypothetical protein